MTTIRNLIRAFLLITILLISSPQAAFAIQSPVGCNANRLTLSIARDKLTVQSGELLTYTVTASNLDGAGLIACDIDTATVVVQLPAPDGTPTGTIVTLASSASFPAGTAIHTVGTVPYTVNVNPGVTDVVAEARVNGVLHDAPTDHSASIVKTIGTAIITPSTPPPSSGSGSGNPSTPKLPNTGVTHNN